MLVEDVEELELVDVVEVVDVEEVPAVAESVIEPVVSSGAVGAVDDAASPAMAVPTVRARRR